jgi:hypothetical protein
VKKLISHKVSIEAIPKGGGFSDGIRFLLNKELLVQTLKDSTVWVEKAIDSIRNAKDPNPFRNSDDESIAGELLKRIDEKRSGRAFYHYTRIQ